MTKTILLFVVLLLAFQIEASPAQPLIVHEWGTFTSLQDETGRAIGAINSNDEPLPRFVRRIGDVIQNDYSDSKGVPEGLPSVTMRLETPVVYFHLPPGETGPVKLDVTAEFHAGLLSEFYPGAVVAPRLTDAQKIEVTDKTVGTCVWRDLSIGGAAKGPVTKSHVWTAPRAVEAAGVTSAAGESEKYLFYRGIGHVDSPLRVVRTGEVLELRDQRPDDGAVHRDLYEPVKIIWLAEFTEHGACAFRAVTTGQTPSNFAKAEFSTQNVAKLRTSMKAELLREGLFDDEAEAMLNTWEQSYFKSAGMRLFFMVPRDWTDRQLKLTISRPAELTRVMVGRVEIVTPQQREMIKRLADAKTPKRDKDKLYQRLGRFRDALIEDAMKRGPMAGLIEWVQS